MKSLKDLRHYLRVIVADNAQERLPRLLALVPWLAARPGVTLSETARHFGISIDQLTTDLYQLVVCGLPGYGPDQLVDIDFYDEEHIWVTDPQTLTKPLRFTAEEIIALSIALRLLAQIPGIDFRADVERLMAKLDRAGSPIQSKDTQDLVYIVPRVDPSVSALVDEAMDKGLKLEFEYHSGEDTVTTRTVSPIKVFIVDDFIYLDAFCDQAEALRLFRLDRMREITISNDKADPIDEIVPLRDIDLLDSAPRAILEITADHAWLAEEPGIKVIEQEPLRLSVPYFSIEWLLYWTLSTGGSARIIEPMEAAERLCTLIESSISRIMLRD